MIILGKSSRRATLLKFTKYQEISLLFRIARRYCNAGGVSTAGLIRRL
jgi:hypothetical protein